MSVELELEQARAENVRLRAMLGRAGVTLPPPIALPSDARLEVLLGYVEKAHPTLRPPAAEVNHRAHFAAALRYLALARRQDELNSKYAIIFFVDECNQWLDRFGYAAKTSLRAFCAAAVASGVKTSNFVRYPFDIEIGLGLGAGDKINEGWREVIRLGKVPQPLPLQNRPPLFRNGGPSPTVHETPRY